MRRDSRACARTRIAPGPARVPRNRPAGRSRRARQSCRRSRHAGRRAPRPWPWPWPPATQTLWAVSARSPISCWISTMTARRPQRALIMESRQPYARGWDLLPGGRSLTAGRIEREHEGADQALGMELQAGIALFGAQDALDHERAEALARSEERRVGKECRARRRP